MEYYINTLLVAIGTGTAAGLVFLTFSYSMGQVFKIIHKLIN